MKSIIKKESDVKNSGILTTVISIVCMLLSILLIFNITIIVKGTMDSEKPPSILGVTPMIVLSGSMSGTQEGHIEVGDLIFAKSIEADALKEGDVISYMSGGATVTHRIMTIGTDETGNPLFTTKGDANETEDMSPVAAEQLVGIYVGRIPQVGDFAMFLQKPVGMLLFIGVPLMAFIIYDILRRQKYAAAENKKTQELEAEIERLRASERNNIDA